MSEERPILVGDNPFHRVSHLSQERATDRGKDITRPEYAAEVVTTAFRSGASGFMFTVSSITLPILEIIGRQKNIRNLQLYAIIPYAYDFVRAAAAAGGLPGLARELVGDIIKTGNLRAIFNGSIGILADNPCALLKSYLAYETHRLKSAGCGQFLKSVLLHEVVTDMALALDMDWLFKTHVVYLTKRGIKPGFETRNLSYLVKKFKQWNISFEGIVLGAPFNSVGFQMVPSREEWERALAEARGAEMICFSILAAGYLKLPQAIDYINQLPYLKGIAVGVSSIQQAEETFRFIKERYKPQG